MFQLPNIVVDCFQIIAMDIELKNDILSVSEQFAEALDETLSSSYKAMNKLNESVEILNQAIHENPSAVMQKAAEHKNQTRKSVIGAVCVGKSAAVKTIVNLESYRNSSSVSENDKTAGTVESALQVISSALFLSVSDLFINDLMRKLESYEQNEHVESPLNDGFTYASTSERILLEDPLEEANETLDDMLSDVLSSEETDEGEIAEDLDWSCLSLDDEVDVTVFQDFSLGKSEEIKLINEALYDVEDINSSLEVTLNLVEHLSALHNAYAAVPSKYNRSLAESKHFTSFASLSHANLQEYQETPLNTDTEFDELKVGKVFNRDFINRHSKMRLKRSKIKNECQSAITQINNATTTSSDRDSKADGYFFRNVNPQVATPEMMKSPARHSLSRLSLRASMTRSKGTPI